MSEKRGYPNPNYTEGDIMPGIPMEVRTELLLDDQLVEYIQKASLFDCLANTIRITGKVDDDVAHTWRGFASFGDVLLAPAEPEPLPRKRWCRKRRPITTGATTCASRTRPRSSKKRLLPWNAPGPI